MSPSPRDSKYINALKDAGLKIPLFDLENEPIYINVARPFSRRARDLYQGFFKTIIKGVRIAKGQGINVDLYLITPRYGIIQEDEVILPHKADMRCLKKRELQELSERLGIREKLSKILQQYYDLVILVLKKDHVPLIQSPEKKLDLPSVYPRTVVISAPSLASTISNGVEFIGIKQIGKRAEALVKLIDSVTMRTLKDYVA